MDKIKELLAKSGCKPELVGAIVESLEKYKVDLQERFTDNFNKKVEAAKKVCVEETEAHKRELSRRLGIFCEMKSAAIEQQLVKTSALSESQAMTKLKKLRALLEGVQLNGIDSGKTAAELEKTQRRAQQLQEERDRAIAEANRKTAIAEKALKHNRQLVTENARFKTEGIMVENRASRKLAPTVRPSRPVTTRATLTENQDRRPVTRQRPAMVQRPTQALSVNDIAAYMDTDLV